MEDIIYTASGLARVSIDDANRLQAKFTPARRREMKKRCAHGRLSICEDSSIHFVECDLPTKRLRSEAIRKFRTLYGTMSRTKNNTVRITIDLPLSMSDICATLEDEMIRMCDFLFLNLEAIRL